MHGWVRSAGTYRYIMATRARKNKMKTKNTFLLPRAGETHTPAKDTSWGEGVALE